MWAQLVSIMDCSMDLVDTFCLPSRERWSDCDLQPSNWGNVYGLLLWRLTIHYLSLCLRHQTSQANVCQSYWMSSGHLLTPTLAETASAALKRTWLWRWRRMWQSPAVLSVARLHLRLDSSSIFTLWSHHSPLLTLAVEFSWNCISFIQTVIVSHIAAIHVS